MEHRIPNEIRPIIHRASMPQIDMSLYAQLLVYMSQHGISCRAGLIDPRSLYYHQDVNFRKASTMPSTVM